MVRGRFVVWSPNSPVSLEKVRSRPIASSSCARIAERAITAPWATAAAVMHPRSGPVLALSHGRIGVLQDVGGDPAPQTFVIQDHRDEFPERIRDAWTNTLTPR